MAEYGWGTPRWAEKVQTMFAAADDLDLGLDLTIGPRWPAIVPTVDDVNDPRVQQQLAFSHAFAPGGTTYDGPLPANLRPNPPSGAERTLIAALVARCAESSCAEQAEGPRLLDRTSVVDVTGQVGPDGTLTVDLPGDSSQTYAVIAFWQTPVRLIRNNYTATSPNFVLDHLSVQGAEATTDFYDAAILTPEVRDAIAAVGRVDLFEDSLELGDSQKWTGDFVEQWQKRRGYSPIPVLPALADAGDEGLSNATFFDFSDGSGPRIRTDYRQTWSDLYINARLDTLRAWANKHGISLRSQPYGSPVDTPEASAHVDVPEGESLVFYHNIEDYKLVSVGAHLTGRHVVSNECCAARASVWGTTAAGWREPGNLQAIYRGYAGGVTQVVWHGYPSYLTRGDRGGGAPTEWPGMSYGGNTSFAEAWGDKGGPNWQDYRPINDHLARLQLVLRQGAPKFDVAVYWQDFGLRGGATALSGTNRLLRSDSPLAERGYTYEYVSPAHLRMPSAEVKRGRLFANRGGYEAMVFKDQETMSVDTARRLLDLTRGGLPLVFVGALPSTTPGFNRAAAEDAELRRVIDRLVRQRGVTRVTDLADVPDALADAGIDPAAAHATDSADVLSVRRTDATTDYYYLFNQASWATEQRLELEGDGRPYELNTWTGQITPITDYRKTPDGVEINVAFEPTDAKVIALSTRHDETFRWESAAEHGETVDRNRGLGAILIDNWSLDVESWTPGESGLPGDTDRTDLPAAELTGDQAGTLPPWLAITPANGYDVDLRDVSGIGTYTSTFTLDHSWAGVRKAHLDLGKVVDTATVTVNGTQLPPLDPQDIGHIDVGSYLHAGENTITVRVSSTLINAVRIAPGAEATGRERMAYGLLGPVRLTPYDARQPTLTVEALEDELPLARGARNRARVRISNNAPRPVSVAVDVTAEQGVEAVPDETALRIAGRSSITTVIRLTGANETGTSRLNIVATAPNGAHGDADVVLLHSDNLALNTTGSPYPRVWSSTFQEQHPIAFVNDGDASTFWVSGGSTPGQAPTAEKPEFVGVELAEPAVVSAVRLSGRDRWSPRSYDVQTSLDGAHWTTVASMVDAPASEKLTQVTSRQARFIRLRITDTWYPTLPGDNTQVGELAVYAGSTTS